MDNYTPCINQIRDVLYKHMDDPTKIEEAMVSVNKIVGEAMLAELKDARAIIDQVFDELKQETKNG